MCALRMLMAASLCYMVRGDTVELKTGERLDGAFRQAGATGVVIEIAGQAMTIPLGRVQAIYFGAVKPTSSASTSLPASGEALDALRGLRSVTESGISFRDYAPRVLDAKVKVDRYLSSSTSDGAAYRNAVESAMRAYQLASQAWGASISDATLTKLIVGANIDGDPVISKCPSVIRLIDQATEKSQGAKDVRAALIGTFAGQGTLGVITGEGPSALWTCASAQVAEAERQLAQHGTTTGAAPETGTPKATSTALVPGPPRARITNQ